MLIFRRTFFFRGMEYMITPKLKERLISLCTLSIGGAVVFYGVGLCSNNETFHRDLVMPVLHRLEPETAHRAAVWAAAHGLVPRDSAADHPALRTSLGGIALSNPLGLAAGFDKEGEACDGMLAAGFGLVEVGSVTPLPQPGNPRPRVFRLADDDAVINRYGFNSSGHAAVLARLEARAAAGRPPVGVNLGRNKQTADPVADYVTGIKAFKDVAAYFVINVSSPNTPGLREMQLGEDLPRLLQAVLDARDRLCAPPRPPLLLKISPDLTDDQRRHVAQCVLAHKGRIGGLVAGNTTTSRPAGLRSGQASETGGLSGRPLTSLSTQLVSDMYRLTGGAVPIVGVGGVFCGDDAYQKLRAGASLVQMYSALALHGSPVVAATKRRLVQLLLADGFTNVSEAVGADHRTPADRSDVPEPIAAAS